MGPIFAEKKRCREAATVANFSRSVYLARVDQVAADFIHCNVLFSNLDNAKSFFKFNYKLRLYLNMRGYLHIELKI